MTISSVSLQSDRKVNSHFDWGTNWSLKITYELQLPLKKRSLILNHGLLIDKSMNSRISRVYSSHRTFLTCSNEPCIVLLHFFGTTGLPTTSRNRPYTRTRSLLHEFCVWKTDRRLPRLCENEWYFQLVLCTVLGMEFKSISTTKTFRPFFINYLKCFINAARYGCSERCYTFSFIPAFTLGIYFHCWTSIGRIICYEIVWFMYTTRTH
jgi:hypothetical protein